MKFTSTLSLVVLLVVSGCSTDSQHNANNHVSNVRQEIPTLETVTYYWKDYGMDVAFCRSADESRWGMTIFETWSIYDQAKDETKVWDLSASRCSGEECLRMIDESLTRFHAEKPNARLDYVAIEMHVVSNLWSEILMGMSQRLSTMDGKMPLPVIVPVKGREPFDMPGEITDEIQHTLDKSRTTAAIESLLKRHGMIVHAVNISNPFEFKDSLGGQKWSEIAKLPGAGISVPGVVEFDLE